jgi:hypothetical protein
MKVDIGMGLGTLLIYLGAFLVLVVLPILTVLCIRRSLSKLSTIKIRPEPRDYLFCYLKGFGIAMGIVFGFFFLVYLLLLLLLG